MKRILSLLMFMLILTSFLPVSSEQVKPYLAVFTTEQCYYDWYKFKPDLYLESSSFINLDFFLQVLKTKSGDRRVIIDIECHGDESGFLATTRDGDEIASTGYVINAIDKYFHNDNRLIVILEACNSQLCIEKTLRTPMVVFGRTFNVSSYSDYPAYPIYGVGRSVNCNNLQFLQHYYHISLYCVDLRKYIDQPAELPDNSKDTELALECLHSVLAGWNP